MIQAARVAFGFSGIYDQDEAERIVEVTGDDKTISSTARVVEEPVYLDQSIFDGQKAAWEKAITSGKKTAQALIAWIEAKGTKLTDAQLQTVNGWMLPVDEPTPSAPAIDPEDIPFN